jgi:hypothetical protein
VRERARGRRGPWSVVGSAFVMALPLCHRHAAPGASWPLAAPPGPRPPQTPEVDEAWHWGAKPVVPLAVAPPAFGSPAAVLRALHPGLGLNSQR